MPLAGPPYIDQPWRQKRRPTPIVRGRTYPISQITGTLKEPEVRHLLFCPAQGGWHTGEWREGAWRRSACLTKFLEPTHFALLPEEPA